MKYVLDTNVVSELTKPEPHAGCVDWLRRNAAECGLTTITLAEMQYGIERLPAGKRQRELARTLRFIRQDCGDWILDFDEPAALAFGSYAAEYEAVRGLEALLQADIRDLQIASIARARALQVVTRNTSDFPSCQTLNPFKS